MSLLVHLPLNGNLNNYGLSDLTFSALSTNTSVNNQGKIGKCYNNNSNTEGGLVSNNIIDLSTTQSMFCWVNFTSLMSNSELGAGLVTQHRYTNNRGMGLTIKYVSSTTGYLSVNTGNGSARTYNTYISTTLMQAGNWYHVGYTYDGSNIRLYVNGVLEKTQSFTGMSVPADYIAVFAWSLNSSITNGVHNNYKLNGMLNDIRIYNHCLSPKEVKEISKGLIVHYPLDDIIQPNLIPNQGQYTESNPYILTTTVNDGNRWLQNSAFEVKPSTTYTYSVCCDGEIASSHLGAQGTFSMWLYLCNDGTSKNWQSGQYDAARLFLSNNNNHKQIGNRHIWTYTTTANEKYMSIRMNNYGTGGVTHNYWNFKVEEGNVCTLWLPNVNDSQYNESNFGTKTIYDCSGCGHDGTVTGTLNLSNDSPRYQNNTKFTNLSYIQYKLPSNSYHITYSFWVKASTFYGYGALNIQKGNPSGGDSPWFSFNTERVGLWAYFGGISPNYTKAGNSLSTNTWYHVVYVWNNGVARFYLNGIAQGNAVTYNREYIPYSTYSTLGNSFTGTSWSGTKFEGSVSDFRVYCTALSADDILELYNTSAFITNNGTTECYEFDETGSNPIINKTGIVSVGNLYEDGVGEDTKMNLDTEQTKFGSDFITSKQFNEI